MPIDSDFFDQIKTKWDEKYDSNVFRYKVNKLPVKVVGEKYVLLWNPDRSTKRRTPQEITNVCQPFDENKFNFTKVSDSEIVLQFTDNDDEHTILVNVSPISRYHTLLCPSLNKCLPQIVTEDSLKLALKVMLLSQNRDLRIAYNSLCGLASVNHLHYHLLIEENNLPVETEECKHLIGPVYYLNKYIVPAFCFEITTLHSIDEKSQEIYKLIEHLLKKSIAHNIFITRGKSVVGDNNVIRLLVYPRKSCLGVKYLHEFNVAACEFSGWILTHTEEAFNTLETEDIEKKLIQWKVDNFEELCEEVKSIY